MSKHYYLVASLPYLKFGARPPLSTDEFFYECRKWLSSEGIREIELAEVIGERTTGADSAVLREWKDFDMALRMGLAEARAAKKNNEDSRATGEARDVMEEANALLMEKRLAKIRWDFIEEQQVECYFDTNWLVFYYLKLRILERMSTFDKDKGESFFYRICEVQYEHEQQKG